MRPDIRFYNRSGEEAEEDVMDEEDDASAQPEPKSKKSTLTGPISYTEVEGARSEEPWVVLPGRVDKA